MVVSKVQSFWGVKMREIEQESGKAAVALWAARRRARKKAKTKQAESVRA